MDKLCTTMLPEDESVYNETIAAATAIAAEGADLALASSQLAASLAATAATATVASTASAAAAAVVSTPTTPTATATATAVSALAAATAISVAATAAATATHRRRRHRPSNSTEAEAAARAPVNFSVNYAFSKRGCEMFALGTNASLQCFPQDGGISCDVRNMYNTAAQPLHEDGSPNPNAPGREAIFDFVRLRIPALLPCARLVAGRRELIRLNKTEAPLHFPDGAGAVPRDDDEEPDPFCEPDPEDPALVKFCVGMPQGKCLSTALCIGALHEAMHVVQ